MSLEGKFSGQTLSVEGTGRRKEMGVLWKVRECCAEEVGFELHPGMEETQRERKESQGEKARATLGFCWDSSHWSGEVRLGFVGAFGWGLGVLVLHIGALVRGVAASKGFLGFGLCGSHMLLHLSSSAPYHAGVLFLCCFILSTACERRGALPIDRDFCRVRFVKQSRPRKEARSILCPPFIRRKLPQKLSFTGLVQNKVFFRFSFALNI